MQQYIVAEPPEGCPPWFFEREDNGTIVCECGDDFNRRILCNDEYQERLLTFVILGNCMTFNDNSTTEVITGNCPVILTNIASQFLVPITQNASELDEFMCGSVNKEGFLCSRCKPGFGPSLFSYDCTCVECTGNAAGLLAYFLVQFVPITIVFLVIILAVQINLLVPALNAFTLCAQLLTLSGNLWVLEQVISQINYGADGNAIQLYIEIMHSIYALFSLDFFSPFLNFCVSENLSFVQVYSLRFVAGHYVVFLLIVTFVLVELHDRNFKPIVWLATPFRKCAEKVLKGWDVRASLTQALATFLLLSYVRISTVAAQAFRTTNYVTKSGEISNNLFYFDPRFPVMSGEHLNVGIVAILSFVFITLPLPIVLFFYQFKVFQLCIACTPVRFREGLRSFVEAFQGYYKDGTNGTRDYRYFAAFYFILRLVMSILPSIAYDFTPGLSFVYQLLLQSTMCIVIGLVYSIVGPYKENIHNIMDSVYLVTLGFCYYAIIMLGFINSVGMSTGPIPLALCLLYTAPLIYILTSACVWLVMKVCSAKNREALSKSRLGQRFYSVKTKSLSASNGSGHNAAVDSTQQTPPVQHVQVVTLQSLSLSLADRIVHPAHYAETPL